MSPPERSVPLRHRLTGGGWGTRAEAAREERAPQRTQAEQDRSGDAVDMHSVQPGSHGRSSGSRQTALGQVTAPGSPTTSSLASEGPLGPGNPSVPGKPGHLVAQSRSHTWAVTPSHTQSRDKPRLTPETKLTPAHTQRQAHKGWGAHAPMHTHALTRAHTHACTIETKAEHILERTKSAIDSMASGTWSLL